MNPRFDLHSPAARELIERELQGVTRSAPVAGGPAMPGPGGPTFEREYRLPEGKREALIELMSRPDVPTLIRATEGGIQVIATERDQAVFKAFVDMICPEGRAAEAERVGAIGRPEIAARARALALREAEVAGAARPEAAHAFARAQKAESRHRIEALLGQQRGIEAQYQALEQQSDTLRDRAEELRDRAEELRERAEECSDRGAHAKADELLAKAAELDASAQALEQNAEALARVAAQLDAQARELERQAERFEADAEAAAEARERAEETEEAEDSEPAYEPEPDDGAR